MPIELQGVGLIYDLKEVAAMLKISTFTVLRDYRKGWLPGRKLGSRIVFTADAIKRFLETGSAPKRKAAQEKQQTASTGKPGPQAQPPKPHRLKMAVTKGDMAQAAAADDQTPATRSLFAPVEVEPPRNPPTEKDLERQDEINAIMAAMKKTGNHRVNAAKELGYTKQTLWRKCKDYGLSFQKSTREK